uniref:Tetratricopeptide repeat domain 19 n=1 Tax=Cyprinus carpio TaxID=7962 RepID=A0A8C2GH40_CYPCA
MRSKFSSGFRLLDFPKKKKKIHLQCGHPGLLLHHPSQYSMMIGELDAASGFLHKAVHLAHQMHNNDAIIYTYSLHVTLFVVFLLQAEKLFKAAMSFYSDDNAVIVMSLKLASIYATQNKNELAEHGFQFSTESLKAKIEKQKEFPPESLSDEERKDTRLLLGLSLDTRVRYLAANHRFTGACRDYQYVLQTCQEEQGESHPQSLVLMSDLATVLDLQGKHDEALAHVKKAVEFGQAAGHPDQHFEESGKLYQEALALARTAGDGEAIEQLQEGLKELASRRAGKRRANRNRSLRNDPKDACVRTHSWKYNILQLSTTFRQIIQCCSTVCSTISSLAGP